jgi:uncharacterized protein (DUF2235 family)
MANTQPLQAQSSISASENRAPVTGRNLVVLSDGTGNSAASASKTNVWRLYQALDVTDGTQIAAFSDGVGTSNILPLRILGQALGFGVQGNVIRLYKFLCRNYVEGDQIWAFGFSRGAFTIRVLAGLILEEGLVCWKTEAELDRNALAVYRDFRRVSFPSSLPWVVGHRFIRDWWAAKWNSVNRKGLYAGGEGKENPNCINMKPNSGIKRQKVKVRFVGVWDTVAAYGLPIQELTDAFDKWVWPLSFPDKSLGEGVEHARQALSLDDDRRTFHPIPWDETKEKNLVDDDNKEVKTGRLLQVWFAGAHASIGGGYADDGLSLVALNWMIGEAQDKNLRFLPPIVENFKALANPTGRIYDPRSGFGMLYRYAPRDVQSLMLDGNTPIVNGSVMTRIASGTEGYAPISLPENIDVLAPIGAPVHFDVKAVEKALKQSKPGGQAWLSPRWKNQELVLHNTLDVASAVHKIDKRTEHFELIRDTVWWRQANYFASVLLVLTVLVFPFCANHLEISSLNSLDKTLSGVITPIVDLTTGFLPSFLEPWISSVRQHLGTAVAVALALFVNFRVSDWWQRQICDRARATWNAGTKVDYLQQTGVRGAFLSLALLSAGVALFTLWSRSPSFENPAGEIWILLYTAGFALFFVFWLVLLRHPPKPIDPANPGFPYNIARKMRTQKWTKCVYKKVETEAAPRFLLFVAIIAVILLLNRAFFDLESGFGAICQDNLNYRSGEEVIGSGRSFSTSTLCSPTRLWLVEGRKYRIKLHIADGANDAWFDKAKRTDVEGFATDSWRHLAASPLKRWWRENWLQPIARIGEAGNFEHALHPAAPLTEPSELTAAEASHCPARPQTRDWEGDISSPADEAYKDWELSCENANGIESSQTLISDIVADASGELFIYVNDAVLALPIWTDKFYRNNSGRATVEVTRIAADEIIPAKKACDPAQGSCPRAEGKQ